MVEEATQEVIVTPAVFFDCIDRLKKSSFSILSARNTAAVQLAEEIQAVAKTGSRNEVVLKFCSKLNAALLQVIENAASSSKFSIQKPRIWREFHKSRCSKLKKIWMEFMDCLLNKETDSDPLLMQNIFEECFNLILKAKFKTGEQPSQVKELTSDESNALRYVAGYVPHNLSKKLSKGKNHSYKASFLQCLHDMGVKGEDNSIVEQSSLQDFTKTWIHKINRGGLFFIKDEVMEFFFQLEIKVREYLPKLSSQKNGKETIVSELVEDNDIQFHWCLISTSIDDETASQQLLRMVAELWLTIRGFSHAAAYVENYKQLTKIPIKRATRLRRGLKRKCMEEDH